MNQIQGLDLNFQTINVEPQQQHKDLDIIRDQDYIITSKQKESNILPNLQNIPKLRGPQKTLKQQFCQHLTDYQLCQSKDRIIIGFKTKLFQYLQINVAFQQLQRKIPLLATKVYQKKFISLKTPLLAYELSVSTANEGILTFLQICSELSYQKTNSYCIQLFFTRRDTITNYVFVLNEAVGRMDYLLNLPYFFTEILKNPHRNFLIPPIVPNILQNLQFQKNQAKLLTARFIKKQEILQQEIIPIETFIQQQKITIDVPLQQSNTMQYQLQRIILCDEISIKLQQFCKANQISLLVFLQAINFMSKECEFQADFEENIILATTELVNNQFIPLVIYCQLSELRSKFLLTVQSLSQQHQNQCIYENNQLFITLLEDVKSKNNTTLDQLSNDLTIYYGDIQSNSYIQDFIMLNSSKHQVRKDKIILNIYLRNNEINLNWSFSPEIQVFNQLKILQRFQCIIQTISSQLINDQVLIQDIDMGDALKKYFNV
ncbi:hypothetical protein SS50377_26727 [Spironucleus salmonicida]|uniref:Uncharacterized protein n=2 Tax=Spironucleus salmonicida TaxID=348837 RepID=A0A9P8LM53_9EUKA|nr:hypothetical protein SS50377_26727 [Spironucleus salmonicida]